MTRPASRDADHDAFERAFAAVRSPMKASRLAAASLKRSTSRAPLTSIINSLGSAMASLSPVKRKQGSSAPTLAWIKKTSSSPTLMKMAKTAEASGPERRTMTTLDMIRACSKRDPARTASATSKNVLKLPEKGIYLGIFKTASTMDGFKVMVNEHNRIMIPLVFISENQARLGCKCK